MMEFPPRRGMVARHKETVRDYKLAMAVNGTIRPEVQLTYIFLIFVAIIRPSNLNPMLLMMRGKFRELTV